MIIDLGSVVTKQIQIMISYSDLTLNATSDEWMNEHDLQFVGLACTNGGLKLHFKEVTSYAGNYHRRLHRSMRIQSTPF